MKKFLSLMGIPLGLFLATIGFYLKEGWSLNTVAVSVCCFIVTILVIHTYHKYGKQEAKNEEGLKRIKEAKEHGFPADWVDRFWKDLFPAKAWRRREIVGAVFLQGVVANICIFVYYLDLYICDYP